MLKKVFLLSLSTFIACVCMEKQYTSLKESQNARKKTRYENFADKTIMENYIQLIKRAIPRSLAKKREEEKTVQPPSPPASACKLKPRRSQLSLAAVYIKVMEPAFAQIKVMPKHPASPFISYETAIFNTLNRGDFTSFFAKLRRLIFPQQKSFVEKKWGSFEQTALHFAACFDDIRAIDTLIKSYGAEKEACDSNQRTALHYAAAFGRCSSINTLISNHYANTEATNKSFQTPLFAAAERNQPTAVNTLIRKHAATIDPRDLAQSTPLHVAALFGHLNVVESLVGKGASKSAQDINGNTPLHLASLQGHVRVVALLLHGDYKLAEAKNRNGLTPLHLAAESNHDECIRCLCEAGANPENSQNLFNATPLELAIKRGNIEAMKQLLFHGAVINTFLLFNTEGLSCDGNKELIAHILKDSLASNQAFLERLSEPCCICLEAFLPSQGLYDVIETACCKKFIHGDCLASCFKKKVACPLCRGYPLVPGVFRAAALK